ncbi:beta-glucanase (plasmid) [Kitasatospora sp. NBC_00070]|uniref:beta-glucanase n=1 Tax=Kitasatospora sp. NBC_00070 TaxID=2975962 RepID=UPI002F90CE68
MPMLTALVATAMAMASVLAPADGASPDAPEFLERFQAPDWGTGRTWSPDTIAYRCRTTNPTGWKLDRLAKEALSTANGFLTITARKESEDNWTTGLLTTDDYCASGGDRATVGTGDLLLVHVQLPPDGTGAWPAVWTWRNKGHEVDLFEWHEDHPHTLEFVNHVKGGNLYYVDPAVAPGQWIYIAAHFGENSLTWYAGTDPGRLPAVYRDRSGVGPDYLAHPIVNLSVSDGYWHPRPAGVQPITFGIDCLLIDRPATRAGGSAPDTVSGAACRSPRGPRPGGAG